MAVNPDNHEHMPRRKDGACKQIVGARVCGLQANAACHTRWAAQHPVNTQSDDDGGAATEADPDTEELSLLYEAVYQTKDHIHGLKRVIDVHTAKAEWFSTQGFMTQVKYHRLAVLGNAAMLDAARAHLGSLTVFIKNCIARLDAQALAEKINDKAK
jgi:hypothetical protein